MPAFLAWPVLKMFFGGVFQKAVTWLSHRSFWQLVCMVLGLLLIVQHFQLVGARHSVEKWQRQYASIHTQLENDRAAYAKAQADAAALNAAQIARVKQQQKDITDATVSRLDSRLALIRGELSKNSAPQRPAASAKAGDPSAAPCRASCAPGLYLTPEERLRGAEDEERHQELIDWVIRQSQVNPNAASPSTSERQPP